MKTKEEIQKQIAKNRDEIGMLLSSNISLNLLYIRIRILASQNEKLIKFV